MAGQKSGSAGDKARYTRYKAELRFEKNKRAKIARHVKRNPNDEKAAEALKRTFKYSRATPVARTHFYSRKWKDFAHTLRLVRGSAKTLEVYLDLEHSVYDKPVKA